MAAAKVFLKDVLAGMKKRTDDLPAIRPESEQSRQRNDGVPAVLRAIHNADIGMYFDIPAKYSAVKAARDRIVNGGDACDIILEQLPGEMTRATHVTHEQFIENSVVRPAAAA